ncbi:M23 family metallopeptidase [Chromobacterium phragmitis]|uniref:M23 family metallopeptidase n=1 Tax=Chromobacterium phragmitis TaxID=2202141 RepID=A0ABV0IMI2_9NEIS
MKTFLSCFALTLVALSIGGLGVVGMSLPAGAAADAGGNGGGGKSGFCFAKPFTIPMRISSHATPLREQPTTGQYRPHYGDDIAMPSNTPIYAPADGVVQTVARNRPGAGNYINIQHPSGYLTRYLHLNSISVRNGQRVKTGELLGYSGMTGGVSTGPHLHWEAHIPVYKKPFPPVGPTYMLCQGAPPAQPQEEAKETGDPAETVKWPQDSDGPDPAWEACPIQPPAMLPQEWRLDDPERKGKPY